jgi:hypothetical protein
VQRAEDLVAQIMVFAISVTPEQPRTRHQDFEEIHDGLMALLLLALVEDSRECRCYQSLFCVSRNEIIYEPGSQWRNCKRCGLPAAIAKTVDLPPIEIGGVRTGQGNGRSLPFLFRVFSVLFGVFRGYPASKNHRSHGTRGTKMSHFAKVKQHLSTRWLRQIVKKS